MDTNAWIQTALAVIAIVSIVASWLASSRSIKESNRASKLERTIETAVQLQRAVGELQAEILPFWRDNETRSKYAQLPQEIQVHRAMEDVLVLSRLVGVHARIAARAKTESDALTSAAYILSEAAMTLYLALIPTDPPTASPGKIFINSLKNRDETKHDEHALATAKAIVQEATPNRNEPNDHGNVSSSILNESSEHFSDCLSKFAQTK
jgi:hypothetical protein